MSQLAEIRVYECDGCRTTLCAEGRDSLKIMSRDWYMGLHRDYCEKCKRMLKYQAAIAADEHQFGLLVKPRREYANA